MSRLKRLMLIAVAACTLGAGVGAPIAAANGVNEPDKCNNPPPSEVLPCLDLPGP